jgi:hypothetical protein
VRSPGAIQRTGDGIVGGGKIPNAQVNGRDASIAVGERSQGGVVWDLSSGGSASLYTHALSEDEIRVLAEQIDAGTTALPENLVSIGMTDTASASRSICMDQQGEIARISEIRGTQPSRYAEAMASGTGEARRFDDGDTTFVIEGFPGRGFDATNATYHEATPEEWRQILDCNASGPACDNNSPTTTPP